MEDLRSDFSAIHRIDEIESVPGPRFFSLAYRIAAYPGVVQVLVRQRAARRQEAARPVAPGRPVSLSEWALAHPDAMVAAAKQWKG